MVTTNKINKFLSLAWHSAKKTLGNDHGWVQLAIAGVAAAGAIASALSDKGGNGAEFQNNTQSGNTTNDVSFLFDVEATQAMTNLTQSMNDWSMQDRDYFKNVFEPFQNALIKSNQALLPDIVANSGSSLQSNLKAIMGGDMLQEAFTNLAKETGGDISRFSADFGQMVDQIPTAEQRVGQAISGLEQQFGKAGADLKRQMGAKGMDVSEAGLREMAIGKATAKAGVTDQANQAARMEKLDALERGIGVQSAVQAGQTSQLNANRALTQSGTAMNQQIGGVMDTESLSGAGEAGIQMTAARSDRMVGQTSDAKTATWAKRGMETARFFDPETGATVGADGNPYQQTVFNEKNAITDWKNSLSPEDYKRLNGNNGGVMANNNNANIRPSYGAYSGVPGGFDIGAWAYGNQTGGPNQSTGPQGGPGQGGMTGAEGAASGGQGGNLGGDANGMGLGAGVGPDGMGNI